MNRQLFRRYLLKWTSPLLDTCFCTTTSVHPAMRCTTIASVRGFSSSKPRWMSTSMASSTSEGILQSAAAEFATVAPMVLLQEALEQCALLDGTDCGGQLGLEGNLIIVPRATFDELCSAAHVTDSSAALADLHDAAIVVSLAEGQLVHLRPVLYVEQLDIVEKARGAAGDANEGDSSAELSCSFLLEWQTKRVAEAVAAREEMQVQLQPAIARVARWRRSVWGGALLFAGTQLAVISRLTYFDLDWDIMEPISYFLGIGAALVFYLYFLRYDEDHTYTAFDQRYLPKKVRQYAPIDFDWERYEQLCERAEAEQRTLEVLRAWAKTH